MDFVDLDKVLDQFEEEEKAAEEILPGREIKPSGYAEYLVSHQDQPWESLSLGQALETNSKQLLLNTQTVLYDDPFDSSEKSKLEEHSTLKQLAFPNKPGHVDCQVIQDADTRGQSLSLEEELAQSKLKEEKIEAYLPPLHLSNGLGQGTGLDLNGWGGEVKGEEGERRGGLIASQPASIQTDSLSPASEQELLSYPLPKSDILVEGHDQPHSNAQSLAHCQSEDMEPAPNYAPSNDNGITAASTEQHVQDTHDDGDSEHQVNTDVDSEHPTGVSEENTVDASDAGTCPCAGEDGDVAISKTPTPVGGDLELSEKLPEMLGADITLEQGSASVEGHEDKVMQLAVGFDTGECDMDKDEVDAYLEELESSMLADGSDRSEPTAFCDKSKMTLAVNDGGDVPGHTANGEVQKTAFAAVSAEGDHLGPEMRKTTAAVIHSAADGVDNSQGRVESSQHTIADDVADGDRGGNSKGTVESSQQSTAENIADGDEGDNTDVSVNSHEDSGESKLQGQITQHYANIEDMGMRSESTGVHVIRDDHPDFQHPYLEADIVDRPDALFRKDLQIECGMETDETEAVTTTELKADRSADKTPPGLSIVNKPEAKSDVNLKRLVDTTSLEFPVAGNKNGVSSVVKGKLEIEGLLDEIVAARLAQKSSEVSSAEHAPIGQLTVEQAVLKDGDGGEKSRTEGWGPEGSMVCSRVREPSSPEMTSPAQSGSPSPTLGIGARPKDPSQMKKNRPNSLLGLSKISLASPFSPSQQATGPVIEVMLPSTHQGSTGSEVTDRESRTQSHSVGGRPLGVSPPTVCAPPPEGGAVLPMDGSPAPCAMENLADDGMDSPVMRRPDMRGDAGMAGEGEEASNGVVRPQSWSPSTMSSPPTQRTKRPTSLNLPVRQDRMGSLSPDGDNNGTRKTGLVVESGGSSEAGSSAEEESVGIGGTDGGTYQDIRSRDPNPEQEGAGAAAEMPMETPPPSILHLNLGKIAPTWLPDADATSCMECAARFTFTKRRHHCRACGKIFCSTCCGQKSRLTYLENKEGRVCISCYHILSSAHCVRPAGVSCRSPNPNNPIEYCSTVPPTQQANARAPLPTVMVPTGVLKRHGSNRKSEPKQVMFSDGIRPGGDLTELDGSDQARLPPRRSGRAQKKVEKQQGDHSSAKTRRLRGNDGLRNPCLIPDQGLPPVVVHTDDKGEVTLSENPDPASFMAQIRNEEAAPVVFAINLNLFVQVKIINLDCCLKRVVWCFTTEGMVTVGQEELVVVLETLPEEDTVPRDIFCHFSTVYEEAGKGNPVSHMGHSIFNQPFLDSSSHGGFLYLRSTFQCTNKLLLPPPPFLFPILLHKWESPWAKVFPIRLMLRLGAEHRYYPCPLVSIRNRKPVFFEIGHTIMNLLADFRNFQYMLQQIRGVSIHMEDQKTFINFPRNRYQDVMKVVSSSNEHVMALGASFSLEADSHLVCIQNEDGNYQTQAINIQNKPRQVTGASFVVFNGALKSSAGLRAKSSIVEDGLMVQILPEMMGALKQSLKDMKDFAIPCGSLALPQPEEVVTVRWVDDDKKVNVGVKSPVDGLSLEGVESVQVHKATDYVGERYAVRWTQLFFLQTESGTSRWEPLDLSRVAETLANAVCIALTPHLMKLKEAALTKIGLRVTLQPDSVGYEVGSNGERLPDFYINDLDNALIPVIHSAITTNQEGPIVLELHLYLIH